MHRQYIVYILGVFIVLLGGLLFYTLNRAPAQACTLRSDFTCTGYSMVQQADGTTTITLDLIRAEEEVGEFYIPAGWLQLSESESFPCQADPRVVEHGQATKITCEAKDVGKPGDAITAKLYFIYRDGTHVSPDLIKGTLHGTVSSK